MPHHEYTEETQAKLKALREVIEQQAAELAILKQRNPNGQRNPSEGDPCGRSCEGQAYRIELRQALAKNEQQAKEIEALKNRQNSIFLLGIKNGREQIQDELKNLLGVVDSQFDKYEPRA